MNITPTCSPPDEQEIARRLHAVQRDMASKNLDFYLCHDPSNVFYLTNFANFVHERPFILLVPAAGDMTFLMPKLEEPHVRIRSVGPLNLMHYFEFPAPKGQMWSDRLLDILTPNHRVGIESLCPVAVANAIPGETVISDIVDEVRMVKSDFEIARIAFTCDLLSEGHGMLLANAHVGQLPIMLNKVVGTALMGKLFSTYPASNVLNSSFHGVAQPPSLSHDPHNFTNLFSPLVEGGPHVTIVAGSANGYGGEIERTFFIDHVPRAAVRPFQVMLEARALAYELAVPGASMHEVDRRVNELLRKAGYADNLLHRTGHSFGVTGHEAPFLAEGYEREIQPNMIFSIEPGIYIPGLGGFRFSDTVLITGTSNQRLTHGPETLDECTIEIKPQ
jgi:Xaa-Pro dipeptidase